MKSLSQILLKFAAVKLPTLAVLVVVGSAATTLAQNPRIETSQLRTLAAKASETVDVNLDEKMLQLTAKFFSGEDDQDAARVKDLINGLKGIYVKSFEFATEGQITDADLESIRSQLRNPAWNKIVDVSSKKEDSVEVYLMQNGSEISGLALLAVEAKELTVVNIVGPIDLDKLSQLAGRFNIPELNLEGAKTPRPRRKN